MAGAEVPGRCTVGRQAAERITAISTVPGSDSYRLVLADDRIADAGPLAPAAISFPPSGKRLPGLASTGTVAGGQRQADCRTAAGPARPPRREQRGDAGGALPPCYRSAGERNAGRWAVLRACEAARLIACGADAREFEAGGSATGGDQGP